VSNAPQEEGRHARLVRAGEARARRELDDARLGPVSNAEILDNLDSAPLR
jgi:hypothetical protein